MANWNSVHSRFDWLLCQYKFPGSSCSSSGWHANCYRIFNSCWFFMSIGKNCIKCLKFESQCQKSPFHIYHLDLPYWNKYFSILDPACQFHSITCSAAFCTWNGWVIPFFNCFHKLSNSSIFTGIGTLDVALVPLLASIVDSKYIYDDEAASISSYGSPYAYIYAIQQSRLNSHQMINDFHSCDFCHFMFCQLSTK